jgi:hypothetical protein
MVPDTGSVPGNPEKVSTQCLIIISNFLSSSPLPEEKDSYVQYIVWKVQVWIERDPIKAGYEFRATLEKCL